MSQRPKRPSRRSRAQPLTPVWRNFGITAVAIVAPVVIFFWAPAQFDSPTTDRLSALAFPESTRPRSASTVEVKTSEQHEIAAFVREVFGQDSDRAFQLLACENAKLNPRAVNVAGNHPTGSRDIGVFQINEYWQETQGKFLFNWKVNVLVAKQLFDESGGSFRLWSCGMRLGI